MCRITAHVTVYTDRLDQEAHITTAHPYSPANIVYAACVPIEHT